MREGESVRGLQASEGYTHVGVRKIDDPQSAAGQAGAGRS